jgi:hypothetical protein
MMILVALFGRRSRDRDFTIRVLIIDCHIIIFADFFSFLLVVYFMYDYAILGGGISGVYCAYNLLKWNKNLKVAIFEKSGEMGGRVYTIRDDWMTVEAGAGRFSDKHFLFIGLLKELGLWKDVGYLRGGSDVYSVGGVGGDKEGRLVEGGFEHLYEIIGRIVKASKRVAKKVLIQLSFVDYAKTVVSELDVRFVLDYFGYYSELVIMNALDCIRLMGHLSPDNKYCYLKGGFSRVIYSLLSATPTLGFGGGVGGGLEIFLNHTVRGVNVLSDEGFLVRGVKGGGSMVPFSVEARKCICALPANVILRWSVFRPIQSILRGIRCAPLCRIYSVFPPGSGGGKTWFSGMTRFSVNNPLKMVIPIDESRGVIMISYSDNKYARWWRDLKASQGIRGVNRALRKYMKEATGITIPQPLHTTVCYWDCGVGYWGVGVDSAEAEKSIMGVYKRVPGMYLCGEHYSAKSQQWMEGALDTSSKVLKLCGV